MSEVNVAFLLETETKTKADEFHELSEPGIDRRNGCRRRTNDLFHERRIKRDRCDAMRCVQANAGPQRWRGVAGAEMNVRKTGGDAEAAPVLVF